MIFNTLLSVAAISLSVAQVAQAAVFGRDVKASSTYDDGKWTPTSSYSSKPTDYSGGKDGGYSYDKDSHDKASSTVIYYHAKPSDGKYDGKDGKDSYTSTTVWYAPKETGKSDKYDGKYDGKYDDKSGKDSVYHKDGKNGKDDKHDDKNSGKDSSYQDALDKHQDDVEAQLQNTQDYKDAVAQSSGDKKQ